MVFLFVLGFIISSHCNVRNKLGDFGLKTINIQWQISHLKITSLKDELTLSK